MTLVLIDLDGTLIVRRNSEVVFGLELLRRGVLDKGQIKAYLSFYVKWTHRFGFTVAKKNKAYLCGLDQKAVMVLAERYVYNRLQKLVRSQFIERIDAHRRACHEMVLLTGTLDCIAQPLAQFLGIAHVQATRCATSNGQFTAAPPLSHPYGKEKLRIAHSLAAYFNTSLSDCIAYADSNADLPLLRAVSHPVAVAPDRRLARVAKQNGWEIIR